MEVGIFWASHLSYDILSHNIFNRIKFKRFPCVTKKMDHDKLYYGGCNFRIKQLKCLFYAKHKFDVNIFHVANTYIHTNKFLIRKSKKCQIMCLQHLPWFDFSLFIYHTYFFWGVKTCFFLNFDFTRFLCTY